jgi:DNA-binding transcriptional LysR family regulator
LIGKRDYKRIEDVADDPLITRENIPNNNDAIVALEEKHRITFEQKISVIGNLEVIKGMVREGIGNVILPYYAVYKEIESGEFKVIDKINDVKDGYQIVITKDKKDLIQIIKFVNFVQDFRIHQ